MLIPIAAILVALTLAACGSEGISVSSDDQLAQEGATIFSERCGGCHTITAAGTQGSGNRALRVQGPNFDQRNVTYDDALFAIRNGGFSGAIMPQNIVVGDEAKAVAHFIEQYSGTEANDSSAPSKQEDADLAAQESGQTVPSE